MNPSLKVTVPLGVVTETFLVPGLALGKILIFAVIRSSLSTIKLMTVILAPKLTSLASVNPVPVIVTFPVHPQVPGQD